MLCQLHRTLTLVVLLRCDCFLYDSVLQVWVDGCPWHILFYWRMSSVHSVKELRKWPKLWIILYFHNKTDILWFHTLASRYPYVQFVIWGFCWRGYRHFKVFGNYSLCWSTWPSSVYLDFPQYLPSSGDSQSVEQASPLYWL
jgi:hypothetical protein